MEFENSYIVYVKPDFSGYIVAVNSSAFLTDATEWVKIDEGFGDRYHHAQGNYFEKSIFTDGGACRYKLVDGNLVECTAEEITAQIKPQIPIASRNVTAGEYFTVDGVFYKATENIPNGGYIIVGQNVVVTTVEEQLYELTKGG